MAVQTESITRDVAVQYDYDDICQFVEYEHSYAQRESTPKPVTSHPENSSQLQTEIGDHANSSLCTNDSVSEVSNVSVSLPNMSVMSEYQPHDTDTQPETSVSEIEDSLEVPEAPNMVEERKFIVFESCLDDLLHRCPVCGKLVLKRYKSVVGSNLSIITECSANHKYKWTSQPRIRGMAAGNLLLSASVLYSGSTYRRLSHLAELLNLQIMSTAEFYRIQDAYLFPVISNAWKIQQETLLTLFEDTPLKLSGDGRCDSPGYSAKYGSYTVMESNQVLS